MFGVKNMKILVLSCSTTLCKISHVTYRTPSSLLKRSEIKTASVAITTCMAWHSQEAYCSFIATRVGWGNARGEKWFVFPSSLLGSRQFICVLIDHSVHFSLHLSMDTTDRTTGDQLVQSIYRQGYCPVRLGVYCNVMTSKTGDLTANQSMNRSVV